MGSREDRADSGLDVDADTHRAQRHDDVGEQDRGVDAISAHRLKGQLDDRLCSAAGLEHRHAVADLPVFG